MSGVGPPTPLVRVLDVLDGAPSWALEPGRLRDLEERLAAPGPPTAAASLSTSCPDLMELRFLSLREAGSAQEPAELVLRLQPALTSLAGVGVPVVVCVGSDRSADAQVAVGFPATSAGAAAAALWRSDCAPDLLWEPTDDVPGSRALTTEVGEVVMATRPVPLLRPQDAPAASWLARLLAVPTAGWSVVLRLRPLSRDQVGPLRHRLATARLAAAEHANRAHSLTESSSVTVDDPVGRSLVAHLDAWQTLVDDAAAEGGWSVTAHVRADDGATRAVLGAITAGAVAGGSGADRGQRWDASVADVDAAPVQGWLSSTEVAGLLLPPAASVGGLRVRHRLPAGRGSLAAARPLVLGTWSGTDLEAVLDVDDLAGHCFVAGITGSGKTTTTTGLLCRLWNDHRVPFLVVDPAKGDHEELAPLLDGGLQVVTGATLRTNALAAWPGSSPSRHVAAVGAAFRAAFALPVPTPFVLSLLLDRLAADADAGVPVNLHDVGAALDPLVDELGYRGEIEANIRASLGLRLRHLLEPRRAERVAGPSAPAPWLVDRPTLVRLDDIADDEERSFLVALLVLWVGEAARVRGASSSVRHVTVLEEAHRLVPEPGPSSGDGASTDAAGAAARLVTQLLAEVRGYGESVLVVDQSPAAVAAEVLRNTATKIAHRVVDVRDQESLGGALGFAGPESAVLGSLRTGRALLSTGRLLVPQAVDVHAAPAPLDRPGASSPPPYPDAPCHRADDAVGHHRCEQQGARAARLVALWVADGGRYDLVPMAGPLADEVGCLRTCVIEVGLRWWTATARRVGHAGPPGHHDRLRSAALDGSPPPSDPSLGLRGPYPGCSRCPVPCVARVYCATGGHPLVDVGRSDLSRARDVATARNDLNHLATLLLAELEGQVDDSTRRALVHCACVHAAAASAFPRAIEAELAPGR